MSCGLPSERISSRRMRGGLLFEQRRGVADGGADARVVAGLDGGDAAARGGVERIGELLDLVEAHQAALERGEAVEGEGIAGGAERLAEQHQAVADDVDDAVLVARCRRRWIARDRRAPGRRGRARAGSSPGRRRRCRKCCPVRRSVWMRTQASMSSSVPSGWALSQRRAGARAANWLRSLRAGRRRRSGSGDGFGARAPAGAAGGSSRA